MKIKKKLSFCLAFLLLILSMANCGLAVSANELDSVSTEFVEETEIPITEDITEDQPVDDSVPEEVPDSDNDSEIDDISEETETVVDITPEERDETASDEESEDLVAEEEQESQKDEVETSSELKMTISYDDRYSFADAYPDYQIDRIENEKVTSYKVSAGKTTTSLDDHVVLANSDSKTDIIATGIGTADLVLVNQDGSKEIVVHITVKAATLTLMFLAGQSNIEGCCGNDQYNPQDSIPCTEGTVYSTFAYKAAIRGKQTTGLNITNYCDDTNTADHVAESLTSNLSLSGKALQYPLNELTTGGNGKTGPDSGLAYEWNRLTGEKVWAVNTGFGGSAITPWTPGGDHYKRAYNMFSNVLKVYKAEIAAGHYAKGKRLFFWLQGEADRLGSAELYTSRFLSMFQGFDALCSFNYCGIISVRAAVTPFTGISDIAMNGPRISQCYLTGKNSYSKIYMVTNVNEKWITDSQVEAYFSTRYPSGTASYPQRSNASYKKMPTTVAQVHPDIHFTQVAHNENGIDAARNMYKIVNKITSTASGKWIDNTGATVSKMTVAVNVPYIVVASLNPSYMQKTATIVVPSGVSYDQATGTVIVTEEATKTMYVKDASGNKIKALTLVGKKLEKPAVTSIKNAAQGVKLDWNAVSGADQYAIYRKTESSVWKKIGTSSDSTYTDQTAVSGTTYIYTVCCVSAATGQKTSEYNAKGWTITCFRAPSLSSAVNVSNGISVRWAAVTNASGYYIYRKTGTDGWARIATVSRGSTTTYTDTTAKAGVVYSYTVKAFNANTYSSHDTKGVTMCRLKGSSVTALSNPTGYKLKVTYTSDTSCSGYQLLYKDVTDNITLKLNISGKTVVSKTIPDLEKNHTYKVMIRSKKTVNGKTYYSAWSAAKSIKLTK